MHILQQDASGAQNVAFGISMELSPQALDIWVECEKTLPMNKSAQA
jgi:hypothetical protein